MVPIKLTYIVNNVDQNKGSVELRAVGEILHKLFVPCSRVVSESVMGIIGLVRNNVNVIS